MESLEPITDQLTEEQINTSNHQVKTVLNVYLSLPYHKQDLLHTTTTIIF